MEYVILLDGRVIWGPREWNPYAMDSAITLHTNVPISLPLDPLPGPVAGFTNMHILAIDEKIIPSYDPIFETLQGPTWIHDVPNKTTKCLYEVVEDNFFYISSRIKSLAASRRWEKERQTINIEIAGSTHTFSTAREERDKLLLLSLHGIDTTWKQPDGSWVSMTSDQIKEVVAKINQAVQDLFQQEADICAQVDSSTTVEELKQIYNRVNT